MHIFKVQGIACGGCVRKIIAAIVNIDDEAKVDVDRAVGIVRVESELEAREIQRAVEDAGHAATQLVEAQQ